MKYKKCTLCHKHKTTNNFYKDKRKKSKLTSECKKCAKIRNNKYRLEHKEYFKEYYKKYCIKNKEKIQIQHKKYHLLNKNKHNKQCKKWKKTHPNSWSLWYKNNKEHRKIYMKSYQLTHKKERAVYRKNQRKNNIRVRILDSLRARFGLIFIKRNRSLSTMFLIGCEIDYLLYYLQNKFTDNMNWDNYGKWHIDHIKPCCSFDLSKIEEQKKCFHYTNLQPLWAIDNIKKGSKIKD
jgi:hypothetical protein